MSGDVCMGHKNTLDKGAVFNNVILEVVIDFERKYPFLHPLTCVYLWSVTRLR